ncbi:hypothetical protein VoSk93_00430 [Vibrio owensii]
MINEIMSEKSVASLMLSKNGTLAVQYGDKVNIYQSDMLIRLPISRLSCRKLYLTLQISCYHLR